jgi:hypothetical protein
MKFYLLGGFIGMVLAGLFGNEIQAQPQQRSLRFLDSLILDDRNDNQNIPKNDDCYQIAINRLNFQGQSNGFDFQGRFDSVFTRNPAFSCSLSAQERSKAKFVSPMIKNDPFRVERLSVSRRFKDLQIIVGDLYQQMGRGQMLALRKVDELGLDIALRGAQIRYNNRNHVFYVLGGFSNVVNLDTVSQRFVRDVNDFMFGGQYGYRGLGIGEFGLMYLQLRPTEQQVDQLVILSDSQKQKIGLQDANSSIGFYFDSPKLTNFLGVYAEVDYQQRREIEKVEQGKAAYLSTDLNLGKYNLLTEGTFVDHFRQSGSTNTTLMRRFDYNQGPTLERIDQEVAEFYSVRGARSRLQREFLDGDLLVHTNALYRINRYGDPIQTNQTHIYGGFDLQYQEGQSRLGMGAGHRWDVQADDYVRLWTHFEIDWVQYLKGPYSFHIFSQNQIIRLGNAPNAFYNLDRLHLIDTIQRNLNNQLLTDISNPEAFFRSSTVISFDQAGVGSLGMEIGADTQNPLARNLFYAGLINWDVNRWFKIRSIIGSQRGGIKCIGGVCRDFPAFSGFRIQLIINYDAL